MVGRGIFYLIRKPPIGWSPRRLSVCADKSSPLPPTLRVQLEVRKYRIIRKLLTGWSPVRSESINYSIEELTVLAVNYFLRARAPAAATDTTAIATAAPTKSAAPVSGFAFSASTGASTSASTSISASISETT